MENKNVATVLVIGESDKILMVSRKDDHSDFGLAGGKEEDIDNGDILETAIRECYEETGITLRKEDLELLYVGKDGVNNQFMCYCFLATQYSGTINNDLEDGVVQWGDPQLIKDGTFGEFNKKILEIYNNLVK